MASLLTGLAGGTASAWPPGIRSLILGTPHGEAATTAGDFLGDDPAGDVGEPGYLGQPIGLPSSGEQIGLPGDPLGR